MKARVQLGAAYILAHKHKNSAVVHLGECARALSRAADVPLTSVLNRTFLFDFFFFKFRAVPAWGAFGSFGIMP